MEKINILDAYIEGDYTTTLHEWQPLAEQGDADAQFNLGVMYANGRGVSRDDKAAAEWSRRAAEQGLPAAKAKLGGMYAIGRGVPQDDKAAVQ